MQYLNHLLEEEVEEKYRSNQKKEENKEEYDMKVNL